MLRCQGARSPKGDLSFFWANPVKTNVYVDGFNLYYGCIKGTAYRWLDLAKLCALLLPSHDINRIRYFTALVDARPDDPQQPQRQQTYLRALQTIPNLSIHYGHFLSNVIRMPLAHPLPNGPRTVAVVKTEEKGSDVNLATYLLVDAFKKDCEVAVVISNDSDLKTPVEFVRSQLGLPVGILNPHKNRSRALYDVTDFYKPIRKGPLSASQFPPKLTDAHGTITKPAGW
jgi:hypothetical protein